MVLRPPALLALLVGLLIVLAALAMLIPHGGERMVARASSKLSVQALRDCLGSKLGLSWAGDPHAMRGTAFGLRVVVTDNGKSRLVGMFTAGGRKLSSSESSALTTCLTPP
jgi:hypothetical protein